MSELAAGVNSSETLWTVDEVPDPEFGYYTVDSEIVKVVADFPGSDPGYAVGQSFPSKIRVTRGVDGTTAASHDAGAALTAANAFGGGGGLSVTDGTTTVPGATSLSLTFLSVTDEGGGVAGVTATGLYLDADGADNADVGSIGQALGSGSANAGSQAYAYGDGSASGGNAAHTYGEGDASSEPGATAHGNGNAWSGPAATTQGTGHAYADPLAQALGSGDATTTSRATAVTGTAYGGAVAIRGVVEVGMRVVVDGTSGRMGFNGTTPIAPPIVPLTVPVVQDVIDALVALGLITQSD